MSSDNDPNLLEQCRRESSQLLDHIELQRTYQVVLMGLTMSRSFSLGDLDTVAGELTQVLVESLRLDAATVWLGDAGNGLFHSRDRYELRRQQHCRGESLQIGSEFHEKLQPGRVFSLQKTDAVTIPGIVPACSGSDTEEWTLLVAPIHLADQVYGFISCESALPRRWQQEEKFFAAQVASLVPLAIESEARRLAEATSRYHATELAEKVKELSRLNLRLEQASEQLFRSEKMATVGLLAESIVHEVNNSLGFMKSNLLTMGEYMETLLGHISSVPVSENGPTTGTPAVDVDFIRDDGPALLAEISQGLQRIIQTISDLRQFAHPGEASLQRVNIHDSLDAILRLVQKRYWETIEVVKEYGEIPDIECQVVLLNEVLLKLVVHAYQVLNGKGRLLLRTTSTDNEIVIEIADNGEALSNDEIVQLFEPFVTTGTDIQGHATQLYAARRIIAQRGGRIDVESGTGNGTTFRLTLPIQPPDRNNDR